MNIGFDAKRIFHNGTGLGNYGRDTVRIVHDHTSINKLLLYNPKQSKYSHMIPSQRMQVIYPYGYLWKKLSSLWRLWPVTKQIVEDKVDIFHGLAGEIPFGLTQKKIPTIVTVHDLIYLSHPHYYHFIDRIIYTKKIRHAVQRADRIIAISEHTKLELIKYLDVAPDKVSVVLQGCNEAFKTSYELEEKEIIKRKYDLPEHFILTVGTIQERKNALAIIKAILGTDYHLVLIGNEKGYAKKIHKYIAENKLQGQVIFLKNIDVFDLAIIYQLSTLFCYPSLCEGFGIPIIEALFSKVPVITTRGGCFREAGGPSSVYIEPSNIESLRYEIGRLMGDSDLRYQMGNEGYAYVQKFTDNHVAYNLFEIYNSVLNENSSNNTPLELKADFPSIAKGNLITALLITYNEGHNIEEVIENISFANEIIIVDSYSTDDTMERIKKFPQVKVIQREFDNYTEQKSYALKQASNEWILFLDADERIPEKLKIEIQEIVRQPHVSEVAFFFYRKFMCKEKVLRFSGWQSDKNYRLFRKSKVHFDPTKIVHETLLVNGKSSSLKNRLIHYSYRGYEEYKLKMLKYGHMKALEELNKGYHPNLFHFVVKPTYRFVNNYIFRLGMLDGKNGIIVCYLNALSVYHRFKELKRLRKGY